MPQCFMLHTEVLKHTAFRVGSAIVVFTYPPDYCSGCPYLPSHLDISGVKQPSGLLVSFKKGKSSLFAIYCMFVNASFTNIHVDVFQKQVKYLLYDITRSGSLFITEKFALHSIYPS